MIVRNTLTTEQSITFIFKELAEAKGIEVRRWNFLTPINGFYWAPADIPPVIVLDKKLSGNELNKVFTHELGHLQLHQEEGDLIHCEDRLKVIKAEKQADAFASILIDGIKLALLEGRFINKKEEDVNSYRRTYI